MIYRPYPRADRALHQIWRHPARRAAVLADCMITIGIDASGAVNAMRRVQSALTFGWHPDLCTLNDDLNNRYRGAL